MAWLGESGIPFAICFTKMDKLTKNQAAKNIAAYKKGLLEEWETLPEMFFTSSSTGAGRDEILSYIEKINNDILK